MVVIVVVREKCQYILTQAQVKMQCIVSTAKIPTYTYIHIYYCEGHLEDDQAENQPDRIKFCSSRLTNVI